MQNEIKYTIDELVSSGLFEYPSELVKTALKMGGESEYSKTRALKIVKDFAAKEVK